MKMIRVISTKPEFRRAGRAWSGTTELPASELTDTQIAQLKAEPLLVVQEFEQVEGEPDQKEGAGGSPAAKKAPEKK